MLMSVAEIARNAGMYPELAGARVLVTGIQSTRGVDLVRAFGDHGCRMVLVLHDVEGMKHREIADRIGISIGTSKSQLFQARKLLRAMLVGTREIVHE